MNAKREIAVGETLQRLREAQGISLRSLAARAGFSPSFVSQVENGHTSPSIASLGRLASCLGLGLSDFFDQVEGETPAVARAEQRRELTSTWSRARLEPLVGHRALATLEGLLLTIEPGGRSGKSPSVQPAEQLAVVLDGRLHLMVGGDRHRLDAGDAAAIPAGAAHRWANRGAVAARLILVQTRGPSAAGASAVPSRRPAGGS